MLFGFDPNAYSFALAITISDELIFTYEQTHFSGRYSSDIRENLGVGHKEALLPTAAINAPGRVASFVMQAVTGWVPYHFHDTSDNSPPKLTQDVSDNHRLRVDGGNIAAFLFLLMHRHPQEYTRIVEHVRRVAPFFADFQLAPLAANSSKIKLEWRQLNSDAYLDGSALSDGTLRFICLATLLLQPRRLMPSLILLDEPELGLHPVALTLLVEMLRGASMQRQILAATQSVTLLDQLTPDEVIVAEQHDGASTFRHLDEPSLETWLEEYGLGELWLKNVLGGRPK